MVKLGIKSILRKFYKTGQFYRIPFGPNSGFFLEYEPSMVLSMMLGLHEPNTFEACRQILQKDMHVVDLGANRGFFSLYFASKVGQNGVVYAFEPMPDNFAALERTIQRNRQTNIIQPIKAAVVDHNGPLTFFQSENHLMSSVVETWAGSAHGSIIVNGVTLDAFFENKDHGPDFIKMDIEGGGAFALKGMDTVISKYRPILLLESHTSEEDLAIGQTLSRHKYNVFRVGSTLEVKDLHADYTNPYGIHGTVLGIPHDHALLRKLNVPTFQRNRLGQR